MARNILLITADQQRCDALGHRGGTLARTPHLDALATEGFVYERAYTPNTVCMPARTSILTGQRPRTHGVWANGVRLPEEVPTVAHLLSDVGYHTALIGKAHLDPSHDARANEFEENARAERGDTGPWRGFEYALTASHGPTAGYPPMLGHYGYWLSQEHPEFLAGFPATMMGQPGGDTGAVEASNNPIPPGLYHTDWVAEHTIGYLDRLDRLDSDRPFFIWMSFPDPHHPFSPPESELHRVPWQNVDLPAGVPGDADVITKLLAHKPEHWLAYYEGRWRNREGAPRGFVPSQMSHDQLREIVAKTAVMNELIDDACGRVLTHLAKLGLTDNTDILYSTDHGDMLGESGFVFKGPFHTDALMRTPLLWKPAGGADRPARLEAPVSSIDIAPTCLRIADVAIPDWMEGEPLPTDPAETRERAVIEYDSKYPGIGMHLRTIYRDGWICTAYDPSTVGEPTGLERLVGPWVLESGGVEYDGTEGELYSVHEDPHQWHNLWDDPAYASVRADLVDDLRSQLTEPALRRPVEATA